MQQQPITMIQQPLPPPQQHGVRPGFAHQTISVFGITHIILGVLVFAIAIATIAIRCTGLNNGTGPAIFFVVTGIVGCCAGCKKNNCTIIATMVLSIISAVLAGTVVLSFSAIAIAAQQACYYDESIYEHCDSSVYGACIALNSIVLILAIIIGVISILSACLCCRAVCCKQVTPQSTVYFMAAGQPLNTPVPVQFPMVNMASPQGAPYMMQVVPSTSGAQQYQTMTVGSYPQQPTLITVQQAQQPPSEVKQGLPPSSPPPAYSTTEERNYPL